MKDAASIADASKSRGQLLRELQELRDQLERAEETIGQRERVRALAQVARGIVHDVNNALTPIIGAADFLITYPAIIDSDRGETMNLLAAIRSAALETKDLVSRLRAFYKPSGSAELRPVAIDAVIEGVVQLLEPRRLQAEAEAAGSIRIETDLRLPLPLVRASEGHVRDMLIELVVNALEALPKGGTVRIRAQAQDGHVRVTVTDDGIGMDHETLEHCLEPFVGNKSGGGSGIGLTRAHFVAVNLGGRLAVQSAPAKGTTVLVELPGVDASPEAAGQRAADRPLDVLLIEGDAVQREILLAQLKVSGHIVEFASDAQTALQTLGVCRFDVVLLGDKLPGVRSEALVASIRELVPGVPVVYLASHDQRAPEDWGTDAVAAVVSRMATQVELGEALSAAASARPA